MAYCDAVAAAADLIVEEKGLPTTQRVRARAALLERAAQAALSYAAIQDARVSVTALVIRSRFEDSVRTIQRPPSRGSYKHCDYGTAL